jgi:hypothetical protein|tara:strand:+ start:1233 stop:1862 length:630 start_codon:yes stop_codon:yes gene_type:complete
MALDTYSNLKTSIANYLNRSDLTAFLGDFILLTEARLNRELRVREMVNTDTSITTVAGTQSYALPTGYLEATTIIFQSDPFCTLRFISNTDFYNKYNSSQARGKPTYFTVVGTNILLGVPPNSATTLQVNYYKKLDTLSDSNTTNTILTNYPELYLYGSLAESAPFIMQDERINTWGTLYKEALKNANETSSRGSTTSSPLQMSTPQVA